MQMIADTLGLNLSGFLWHLGNYAVLLVALWWIAFRPLGRKLAEREDHVRQSLALADRARAEVARAEEERDALLAAAGRDADAILAAAHAQAREIVDAAHAEARAARQSGRGRAVIEATG